MRNKKTSKPPKSIEFSKDFMEEFGLVPSGKGKIDTSAQTGQCNNAHNTTKSTEETNEGQL